MDVVWENGLKNINIPINMGTLRFKILKIFSLVFCSFNCSIISVSCVHIHWDASDAIPMRIQRYLPVLHALGSNEVLGEPALKRL